MSDLPMFVKHHQRVCPRDEITNPHLEHADGQVRLVWYIGMAKGWLKMSPKYARALAARLIEMADRAEGVGKAHADDVSCGCSAEQNVAGARHVLAVLNGGRA